MSETPRKIKANGHIVQADWNQTDPLQMDYIQNKPELPVITMILKENGAYTLIIKTEGSV
jgi:hypothetical protein